MVELNADSNFKPFYLVLAIIACLSIVPHIFPEI